MNLRTATIQARGGGKWAALTEYAKKLFAETGREMLVVIRDNKYKSWNGKKWVDGAFDNNSEVRTLHVPLGDGDWIKDRFLNCHNEI